MSRALRSQLLPFWFYPGLVRYGKLGTDLVSECGFGGLLLLWRDACGGRLSFAHLFDVLEYKSDAKGYRPANIHPSESSGFFMFEVALTIHLSCLGNSYDIPLESG